MVIGASGAAFVAELFFDGERLAVPLLRGGKVAQLFGDCSQLVIGTSGAAFVAEPFFDSERFVIPLVCGGEVALFLRDHS